MGALAGLVKVLARAATKKVEGVHEVPVPKFDGFPSFVRENPESLGKWARKKLMQHAQDERNGWYGTPKVSLEQKRQWIDDLTNDRHVSLHYVSDLLRVANTKDQLKAIVRYLRSTAADNIDSWERAELIAKTFERIRILDILHMIH